jgi:hypothetical protein
LLWPTLVVGFLFSSLSAKVWCAIRERRSNFEMPENHKFVTKAFLKVTVYPSLHSFPAESKEWFSVPGKTCEMDAAVFRSGMSNAAVWDDYILALLGSRTVNGF